MRALVCWLCALWGRHEGAPGGRLLPGFRTSREGRSPTPANSSFRARGRGPLPTGCGCRGCGCGDPSPTPHRPLLRDYFARCGGGTRAPEGGASCLGVGRPGTGALPSPTSRPLRRAAGARFPLVVGAVCTRGDPAVLGTFCRAAVCRVLCALPGFPAPGGRCGLAPVRVPWLWPAACLSGVPRSPALVHRASSGPVALGAPVGFPDAVVPFPIHLLGGCAGPVEAGREPGSLCLPLASAEAGARGSLRVVLVRGPAMGLSLAGPSGVGLGLRALLWLACVDLVTDASGFPYRPSFDGGLGRCTGAVSCGRQHRPFWAGGRHARVPCVCGCACFSWPGRLGRPPRRVLVRLTFSCGRLWCASGLFGPLWVGVALFVVVVGFLVFLFFFFFNLLRPHGLWLSVFSGPQGLRPWRVLVLLSPPFFFPFFFPPFFFALPCPCCSVVCGPWCRGPWRPVVLAPGPPVCVFFCFCFSPPPSFFLFLFFLPLFSLFVCCFFLFCLCAGSAVLWLVCVSSAVGCAGVCCCGPCALAGAGLRLCCVVGCSQVVPVLCVLLPVLWRCRGVFCV